MFAIQALVFAAFIDPTLVCHGNAGSLASYINKQTVLPGTDLACVISELELAHDVNGLDFELSQLQPSLYSGFTLLQEHLILRIAPLYKSHRMTCSGQWFGFLGDFTHQQPVLDLIRNGYRTASEGFVLGLNENFHHDNVLGLCGIFIHSDISWGQKVAVGTKWDLFFAVYGFITKMFDFSLLGGYGNAEAIRYIQFHGINRAARHHHDHWIWDAHICFRKPFVATCLTFTPFVELDFINDYQSSYKEKGAGSINLQVESKHANLLRTEVGAYLLLSDFFEIKLDYVYNYRTAGMKTKAKMEGTQGYFTVNNLNANGSLFEYNLALKFEKPLGSVILGYGGLLGETFIDQHFTLKLECCY